MRFDPVRPPASASVLDVLEADPGIHYILPLGFHGRLKLAVAVYV
jgi:hypothetical protein